MIVNESDFRHFFGRCRNPTVITNKYTNKPVLVSCGHCDNCLALSARKKSLMCQVHSSLYKYCYFITLTYRQSCIPRLRFVRNTKIANNLDDSPSKLYDAFNCTPRISDFENNYMFSYSFEPDDKNLMESKVLDNGFIHYLHLPDLQRFLKRLRYHLDNFKANDFSYYAVGEYGPVHFRPHFHILLFSNSREFAQNLYKCLYKSWQLGYISYKLADGGISSYLTDYVNNSAKLPQLFKSKQIKPKSVHSSYFASLLPLLDKNSLLEDPYRYVTETLYQLHGKYISLPLFRSSFCRVFPKIAGFSDKTIHELHRDYTSYIRLCKFFKIDSLPLNFRKPSVLADILIANYGLYPDIDKYILDVVCHGDHTIRFTEAFRPLLYRFLYTSYSFYTYLCDSDERLSWQYLKMIIRFFDDCEKAKLGEFYELQQLYSQQVSNPDFASFYFYDSTKCTAYDNFNTTANYAQTLELNPYFKQASTFYSKLVSESVKHKELNDKNDIFLKI